MKSVILHPKDNHTYIDVSVSFEKSKFGEITLELSYDIEEFNGIVLSFDQAVQLKNLLIRSLIDGI